MSSFRFIVPSFDLAISLKAPGMSLIMLTVGKANCVGYVSSITWQWPQFSEICARVLTIRVSQLWRSSCHFRLPRGRVRLSIEQYTSGRSECLIYWQSVLNSFRHLPFIKHVLTTFFSCDQAALSMFQSVVRPSLSVHPSVCLWHLFRYVPVIVSSWNFMSYYHWQKWCPCKRSRSRIGHRGQNPT